MSYQKAMRWQRKHPKGTRQPVLMHTNSGFWPSSAFIESYLAYTERAKAKDIEPMGCKEYYDAGVASRGCFPADPRVD